MRKSHETVIKAFLNNRVKSMGNLSTDGYSLKLFGNVIARWNSKSIMVQPVYPGWGLTSTTSAVISTLCQLADSSYNVGTRNFTPYLFSNRLNTSLKMDEGQWYWLTGEDHGKPV